MPKHSENLHITREQVAGMSGIPEPAAMLAQLLPLLSSETVSMESIVSELERDQALVARMLKLVNSSYYHLKQKVDTVRAAVGLLGLSTVRQTVYSSMCYSCFPKEERLAWSHSYTCSVLIAELGRSEPGKAPNGCLQLTALLHDIGKIVLRRKFIKRYNAAMRKGELKAQPPHVSEFEAFGHEHGEVGSWLLESWKMRPDIVLPIACHHAEKLPSEFARETALLKIADWLDNTARSLERPRPSEEAFALAGIPEESCDGLLEAQRGRIKEIEGEEEGLVAV